MSRLDAALDRFSVSLDRLEVVLNQTGLNQTGLNQTGLNQNRAKSQEVDGTQELAGLRAANARLTTELATEKVEVDRLANLNVQASDEIADAVDGIRRVLGA